MFFLNDLFGILLPWYSVFKDMPRSCRGDASLFPQCHARMILNLQGLRWPFVFFAFAHWTSEDQAALGRQFSRSLPRVEQLVFSGLFWVGLLMMCFLVVCSILKAASSSCSKPGSHLFQPSPLPSKQWGSVVSLCQGQWERGSRCLSLSLAFLLITAAARSFAYQWIEKH